MHRLAVDDRRELGMLVQPGLVSAPVEVRTPVIDELAHRVQGTPYSQSAALRRGTTDTAVVAQPLDGRGVVVHLPHHVVGVPAELRRAGAHVPCDGRLPANADAACVEAWQRG